MRPEVWRTVYLLTSTDEGYLGPLNLAPDGRVMGADAPSRRRWGFAHGCLCFLDAEDRVAGGKVFYRPETNLFIPADAEGLYLLPLVTLDPPRPALAAGRIIVNTIPKSGTYLLDLLLAEIGYQGIGLHLIPRECHDNRGVDPALVHRDPFSRRKFAPAGAIARVMAPGEYAVGHMGDAAQMTLIDQAGVGLIQCQRNLRDVLVSLYRFKRKSVDPDSASDHLWRSLDGMAGFYAFLCRSAEGMLADLAGFATMMPDLPGVRLRFEDLAQGEIPAAAVAQLDRLDEGLGVMMRELLPGCVGRESSTYSGQYSDWRQLWSPEVEAFFIASGLRKANRMLGYED